MLSLPVARYPKLNVSPGLQKRRTIEAMTEQMEGLSEGGPLLIFFEDAHWADPTTIDMLSTLVDRIANHKVLFVITFRPEFEPPWELGDNVARCDLNRLSSEEIGEIIARVAGDAKLPQDLLEQLSDRTDGNPLYIEELTRSVLESEISRGAGGAAAPIYAIPSSLQDTLMARLDRLSSVKEVAQLGAVLGREFQTSLMEAVSPLAPYALHQALEQLEEATLISRRRTEFEDVWIFKHALIQDAAYESILKSRRQQLHLAIAEVIEKDFQGRARTQPEFLAHHFTMAGKIDRAVPYWLAAGASAWGRAAAKEALAHLGRGLELVGGVSDPAMRDVLELKLQSTLGVVHFAATSYASPQAQAAFIRANELCDQVGDLDLRVAVLYGLGAFQTMKGDFRAGHEAFENLLAAAQQAGSPRYMIYSHSMLAWSHYNLGHFHPSVKHGEEVLRLYEEGYWEQDGPRLSAADPKVISESFRSVALWSLGYPDQAAKAGEDVLVYARTLADPYSLAYALVFSALLVPDLTGHPAVVLERSTEGVKLAKDLGYLFMEVIGSFFRARALSALEDPIEALEMEEDARVKCERLGVRYHEAHFQAHRARMLLAAGRIDEAVAMLQGLEDSIEETGEFSQSAEIQIAIGDVTAAAGGDRAAVEAAYARALEIAREQDAKSWELRAVLGLARLRMASGEPHAARKLLAPVAGWFTEGFETPDLIAARSMLEQETV
jgi:tetratricopeptide (TPR) repeat protein